MKGLRIKEILRKNNITQASVAKKLGESNQNLNAALSLDDVRTGLLERIAEVTGIPVSEFYGFSNSATASGDHSTAVAGSNIKIESNKFVAELTAQRLLTEQALAQNDRLISIIEKLTNN